MSVLAPTEHAHATNIAQHLEVAAKSTADRPPLFNTPSAEDVAHVPRVMEWLNQCGFMRFKLVNGLGTQLLFPVTTGAVHPKHMFPMSETGILCIVRDADLLDSPTQVLPETSPFIVVVRKGPLGSDPQGCAEAELKLLAINAGRSGESAFVVWTSKEESYLLLLDAAGEMQSPEIGDGTLALVMIRGAINAPGMPGFLPQLNHRFRRTLATGAPVTHDSAHHEAAHGIPEDMPPRARQRLAFVKMLQNHYAMDLKRAEQLMGRAYPELLTE